MEDEWENDSFVLPTIAAPAGNKWEGEDEDEDVKESWEDEEEEKKDEEKVEVVVKTKPKKSLQEKIAEKERLKREEYERKLKEQEDEMTPEERLRRQQESDLKVALETTFGDNDSSGTGLDGIHPTTKEEFQEFSELLSKKIQSFTKSEEYPAFAEELIRNICVTLTSLDLKKIKTTVDNMYLHKQKIEKGDKAKKNKGKGKAKLKMEGDNVMEEYTASFPDYDDYDDFM